MGFPEANLTGPLEESRTPNADAVKLKLLSSQQSDYIIFNF